MDGPRLENPEHTGKMPYDNCIGVSKYRANIAYRRKIGHIKIDAR
jgi:hypothetical protein